MMRCPNCNSVDSEYDKQKKIFVCNKCYWEWKELKRNERNTHPKSKIPDDIKDKSEGY